MSRITLSTPHDLRPVAHPRIAVELSDRRLPARMRLNRLGTALRARVWRGVYRSVAPSSAISISSRKS